MLPDYGAGSAYHERRRHLQEATLKCLDVAMHALGKPTSLLDLGCGEGALIQHCRRRGVEAIGVDLAVESMDWTYHHDLQYPLDLSIVFEWVLCWEVAEHLQAASSDVLCDSIVRHLTRPNGRLLFTAAVPGQRGPGHVNLQPRAYWREMFEARGLHLIAEQTLSIATKWLLNAPRAPWYARNLQIFGWA